MLTRTLRSNPDAPGRLFPALELDNGWSLSAQAGVGYQCDPRADLEALEDYETVEVLIRGPFSMAVDPTTIGLPEEIVAKFTPLGAGPSLGCRITQAELNVIRARLHELGSEPNAGIPKGIFGWPGQSVFHGTGRSDAEFICSHGVDMGMTTPGYFGTAFYVADDVELAWSNYADFSEGAVVEFQVADDARILDLRNGEDFRTWRESGLARLMGRRDFYRTARWVGIDGVYDRSVGGLAIYNPTALHCPRLLLERSSSPALSTVTADDLSP